MNSAGRPLVSVYREALIARHYAHRTIDTYERWLWRFLRYHQLRHPWCTWLRPNRDYLRSA